MGISETIFVLLKPRGKQAMRRVLRNFTRVAVVALGAGVSVAAAGDNLNGRWAATTTQGGVTIPFRLDISGDGSNVVGTLYGHDKEFSTSGSLKDGKLELNFDHYLVSIVATVKDGEIDGRVESHRAGPAVEEAAVRRSTGNPFHARRYVEPTAAASANVPSIDGVWEVAQESAKGEKAWRLIVKQTGGDITATILRVDGDIGALTGGWQDGKFVASHFDGARPGLLVLTPQPDGSLTVNLNAGQRTGILTAYRPEVARAKGLPEPANYQTHTSVRDPNEVFTYSFPDTTGKIVSNEDPRFKGKVVLAIVTGTWCPNCHDEARYLVELYQKYHEQGLEIVALDFEEPEQQNTLKRVSAFIKQYKIPYTYLIAGAPSEMWDKVPQAVNLNTWPHAVHRQGRQGESHPRWFR